MFFVVLLKYAILFHILDWAGRFTQLCDKYMFSKSMLCVKMLYAGIVYKNVLLSEYKG